MKKVTLLAGLVSAILLGAFGGITLYDNVLNVGRMWETPVVRPHENPIPVMSPGLVPFSGGEALYRASLKEGVALPVRRAPSKTGEYGKEIYVSFCIYCHGKYLDGMGTVGQSFYPLPRNLRSDKVMEQGDKALFHIISYGKERMPPLATTMAAGDRLAVIDFIRHAPSSRKKPE